MWTFYCKKGKNWIGTDGIANIRMKTIRTNRGWWLIAPENDEQEAALEEFLRTFNCSPGPATSTTRSRESDRKSVAPVLQPR